MDNGADEVDMVINIGWAKEGKWDEITAEIADIKAHCKGKLLKVIIETCLLTDDEKIALCKCVTDAKADTSRLPPVFPRPALPSPTWSCLPSTSAPM